MIELIDLKLSLPEILTLCSALFILLISVFNKITSNGAISLTLFLLLIILSSVGINNFNVNSLIFSGQLVVDNLSAVLKFVITITTFVTICYSRHYLSERKVSHGEFLSLMLFSMLGMFILVSSKNMLTSYLGLEVFSISLYALVAMTRTSLAIEAAMKYFLTGAIASGLLLYGISLLFGLTNSLQLVDVSKFLAENIGTTKYIVLSFSYIFILIAIAFKLGLAPFHFWMPDVYQGANNSIASFISTSSKLAAAGFAFRLIYEVVPADFVKFSYFIEFLGISAIFVGNIMAIVQKNIKRMLAYSSISHMGFFILGLVIFSKDGASASLFYVVSYALMTLVAFGAVILLSSNDYESDLVEDFRGLSIRSPYMALLLLVGMFSMAGIPPFSGFFAKFFILEQLIKNNHIYLSLFALIMSVIGSFYYLRVVWLMYFEKPENFEPVEISGCNKIMFSINTLFVILLGIFAQFGIYICKLAFL